MISVAASMGWSLPVQAEGFPSSFRSGPSLHDIKNGESESLGISPTPTSITTPSPGPRSGASGWEDDGLRDFAAAQGWPLSVRTGGDGRLSVSRYESPSDWAMAAIRPFESRAGAEAAFNAEQEDMRLAGYEIATQTFHSLPAYAATLEERTGQVIERRFHWLASSWILSVDLHNADAAVRDPRSLAEDLLFYSVQRGLPQPPGGLSTPAPTVAPSATATARRRNCAIEFSDVPTDLWAYQYIVQLACDGIVSGYGDGTFRPQSPTTRAQLVKMIVLLEGWSLLEPAEPSFRDVGRGHIFYRFVETATARGVISGYNDDTFRPYDNVTRAQVAKMITRSRGWTLESVRSIPFCDVPAGHWASLYIRIGVERGLFSGYRDGCFYPDALATRAQLAKVLVLARNQ